MSDGARRVEPERAMGIRVELEIRGFAPAPIGAVAADLHACRHLLGIELAFVQGLLPAARRDADAQRVLLQQLVAIALAVAIGDKTMPIAQVMERACLAK